MDTKQQYNNPIKLVIAVKKHAVNYQETKHKKSNALKAVHNTKQKEGFGKRKQI